MSVTEELYEVLIAAALGLNEYAPVPAGAAAHQAGIAPAACAGGGEPAGDRPGDDFNGRASWAEVLAPHGWEAARAREGITYWRRPGKGGPGHSATTGHCKSDRRGDLLYVFSGNALPLEADKSYSKFEAHAALNHGGDFAAAAKALAAAGWGKQDPAIRFGGRPYQFPAGTKAAPTLPSACEGRPLAGSGPAANGTPTPPSACEGGPLAGEPPGEPFRRVPISELKKADLENRWLWKGYLARDAITLISALWKAGKTTLLAHLLRALEAGGQFCGLPVRQSRVVLVTEEHDSLWADRRDLLGLGDWVHVVSRPFAQKPNDEAWLRFLVWLQGSLRARPADLVVFDTVVNLWPVQNENDASEVQAALMPLRALGEGVSLALVHHLRKGDGIEATASRGSGAFGAFVDVMVELRRYNPCDRADRRRVLSGYGRYEETETETVIELTDPPRRPDGTRQAPAYRALGDRAGTARHDVITALTGVLPVTPPGYTYEQLEESWPQEAGKVPAKKTVLDALHTGCELGLWVRTGRGVRGDPHLYYRTGGEPGECPF